MQFEGERLVSWGKGKPISILIIVLDFVEWCFGKLVWRVGCRCKIRNSKMCLVESRQSMIESWKQIFFLFKF